MGAQWGGAGTHKDGCPRPRVGLTGTPVGVARAARACRVYSANARPRDAADDLMGPSSFAYLLGSDGAMHALSSGQPGGAS